MVAISEDLCALLDDWIDTRRPDVTDEYGRDPLLATTQGRAHKGTLRGDCYQYTRPCIVTGDCPHDRDQESCKARDYEHAYECPNYKLDSWKNYNRYARVSHVEAFDAASGLDRSRDGRGWDTCRHRRKSHP